MKPLKMPCYYFSYYVAIFLFSCFIGASMGSSRNDTDNQALLGFKAKITGGILPLWNNSVPFCQWYGVTCSRQRQRVIKLELPSSKLRGTLSPFIGNLSFLRVLNLENNSFSHAIPDQIGRLHRLRELRLNNNSFVDKLPLNISHCSKLEVVNVAVNLLEGEIPGELGGLSNLKVLQLAWNKFIGRIPPSLGNLSTLEFFSLAKNRLTGEIPESLGKLKNLTFFSLYDNNGISGIIPVSIFNLSNIRLLDISNNQLQGNLPSNLGITMPHVEILSLSTNQFTGSFPVSISNASNLSVFQIRENKLTGNLPSLEKLSKLRRFSVAVNHLGNGGGNDLSFLCSLTNATSLQLLNIGNNGFGGLLPNCIGNFSSLFRLTIQDNRIYGSLPNGIQNLINLEALGISMNQLSGSIPHGIGRLQKLKQFYGDDNNLSGAIPTSVGNLTMLIYLSLAQNNLQGNIPLELSRCQNLVDLSLAVNNLTGPIPPGVIGMSSLSIVLNLSSNHLTGIIPSEVQNLRNLAALDVSSNKLSGVIPEYLGSCESLEVLNLGRNFFQGSIPSSLSSLRGLSVFDISGNNISGKIPDFLVRFESLRYLNLSFNDLEGALPTEGVFKNASFAFIQGNSKLCGGVPIFRLPRCHLERSTDSLKLKIAIVFAVLGVIILLFSVLLFLRLRKKKEQPIPASSAENSLLQLSYQSILKATNGFCSENLVGSGSFGSVYKGILEEGGGVVIIAVKVLNLLSRGASRSFMAECEALRNIRHRNLVRILTAISGVDYQGNDFKALVYEFMQKGSLEDWLHPSTEMEQYFLTLIQRVNVAVNVASALEYLHHHCETPIIHCDLKPSNILLDDEMVAHVGDFGLAKFLTTERSNQSSSLGLRGTIGYAPPEYGLGSEVSTKGDVYSYGILLLEMFTGKRPTADMFKEGLSLHNFVKAGLAERLDEIIDPVLLLQGNHDHKHFQCLNSILEIGITCSAESPSERMEMTVVAAKLYSIRDKFISATGRVHH